MPIKGILLLVVMAIGIPLSFVRPLYGIVLWSWVSFGNPQSAVGYWSLGRSIPWAVLIAVPTVGGLLVFGRGWGRRLVSTEVAILVLLWIWFTFTTIVSTQNPLFAHHASDSWFRWNMVSKIMLMTVVAIGVVRDISELRVFVLSIAGCFGYFVAKALPFIITTAGAYRVYGPARSMIEDNNDFGLALNMTFPLFFFLAQLETKGWVKWLFRFLMLITVPAVFFTYSRGALLGLLAIGVILVLRSRSRLPLALALIFGISLAAVFAPEAWKARMDPNQGIDASAASRLNAWTFAWNLSKDYPLTGGGFETFTPRLFDIYAPNSLDVKGPHSVYFGVLGEHGYIGLFLYLTLLYACWRSTGHIMRIAKRFDDQRVYSYAQMFRFSLVGFMVSGAFLGRAYFDYYFSIVACIAILKNVCLQEWAEHELEISESAEMEAPTDSALIAR